MKIQIPKSHKIVLFLAFFFRELFTHVAYKMVLLAMTTTMANVNEDDKIRIIHITITFNKTNFFRAS